MPLRFSTLYRKTKPPVEISLILGFGGNSATPERIQKADSPAVLLAKSRNPPQNFLFLLEDKSRRAQIKKCEENFFAGWRGFRATAGLTSLLGVLLKKCSNFVQKTPPVFKIQILKTGGGGGIRTLDTLRYARFPSGRTRPLCDLSRY